MKKALIFAVGVIVGILLKDTKTTLPYGYEYKLRLIDAYDNYYFATETYMDSIYATFDIADTLGETDEACNYFETRDKVEQLIESEL